uniref:Uncharacterized protein n=1 Tax=Anguilla anguilla TaxID=7936 RepID=A0A0E9TGV3_ANGAN
MTRQSAQVRRKVAVLLPVIFPSLVNWTTLSEIEIFVGE